MITSLLLLAALGQNVGQRGTEFTVRVSGASGAQEALFYSPGVKCLRIKADGDGATLHLKADADCRLGEYAFRVRTRTGVTPLSTLRVTPLKVVAEKDGEHGSRDRAQPVPLNVSVAGVLESEEEDCYAVALKKGQRLAAEVEGVRLASRADLALTVHGPDGKELAAVDDTPLFRQDPFVTLIAPAAGRYTITLRHSGRGEDAPYVLHVGDFIRPAAVFPLGGQAGKAVRVKLIGDAAGPRTQDVKLRAGAGPGFGLYPTDEVSTAPTPHPFRCSPFPNVLEGSTAAVAWPAAFNGVISKPGERDRFRFTAKKGERLDVHVFAQRLGSPLDSTISVYGPGGRLVGSNDDDESNDSRLIFTAPASGPYTVEITDKRKAGGPLFAYRIEVSAARPGLAVFLAPPWRKTQKAQTVAVPRGGRVFAYLAARRDGVEGPVTMAPEGLPPGVKMTAATVRPGDYLVPVVFEAAGDAPLSGRLVRFTGRCGGVSGHFLQKVDLVRGPGDTFLHTVEVDRLAVAVVDPRPFRLSVVPPATGLAADGTLEVRVRVERDRGFTAAVEVALPTLPNGVEGPTKVAVPADKTVAVFPLVASPHADLGEHSLVAEGWQVAPKPRSPRGGGAGGFRLSQIPTTEPGVASAPVALKLTAPSIRGTIAHTAGEQGKAVQVVCTLDAPLPAAFTAKLDGLPPRATAPPVAVKAGQKSVTFELKLADTTPARTEESLSVVLAGEASGQKVTYRVGRGGRLTVAVPNTLRLGPGGRPLTPLEALRASEKKKR